MHEQIENYAFDKEIDIYKKWETCNHPSFDVSNYHMKFEKDAQTLYDRIIIKLKRKDITNRINLCNKNERLVVY